MKKSLLLLSLILLAVTFVFLPYSTWLEKHLEIILENKGFDNAELTITNLGFKRASLENITLGINENITLKNVVLEYSINDLWNKRLSHLNLKGLDINVKQAKTGWYISGLKDLPKPSTGVPSTFVTLPITPEQITHIPFESMVLENSVLTVSSKKQIMELPLEILWQKTPRPQLTYKGDNISLKLNELEVTAGSLKSEISLENIEQKWQGNWALDNVSLKEVSTSIPVMGGKGTLLIDQYHIIIEGNIGSADKIWQAKFNVNYNFKAADKSKIDILHASIPWKGGSINVKNVHIPLNRSSSIKVTLQIHNVSLKELMQSLTADHISATGKVSGSLPLLIEADGNVTVLPGTLKSIGPGMISMPPNVIPGNNEQVILVREILSGLQYTGLSISIENDQSNHPSILMNFEGNNPQVYEGRPVKLNVNLTGDVLEFIERNILLLGNPEQFLRQKINEQN